VKISKSELKKIIKEEIESVQLNENPAAIIGAISKYGPMIMKLVDILAKNPEIIDNLADLVTSGVSDGTKPDVSPASE
jgi:hypothetical protein